MINSSPDELVDKFVAKKPWMDSVRHSHRTHTVVLRQAPSSNSPSKCSSPRVETHVKCETVLAQVNSAYPKTAEPYHNSIVTRCTLDLLPPGEKGFCIVALVLRQTRCSGNMRMRPRPNGRGGSRTAPTPATVPPELGIPKRVVCSCTRHPAVHPVPRAARFRRVAA